MLDTAATHTSRGPRTRSPQGPSGTDQPRAPRPSAQHAEAELDDRASRIRPRHGPMVGRGEPPHSPLHPGRCLLAEKPIVRKMSPHALSTTPKSDSRHTGNRIRNGKNENAAENRYLRDNIAEAPKPFPADLSASAIRELLMTKRIVFVPGHEGAQTLPRPLIRGLGRDTGSCVAKHRR